MGVLEYALSLIGRDSAPKTCDRSDVFTQLACTHQGHIQVNYLCVRCSVLEQKYIQFAGVESEQ